MTMTVKTDSDGRVLSVAHHAILGEDENLHLVEDVPKIKEGQVLYYVDGVFEVRQAPQLVLAQKRAKEKEELKQILAWLAENDWKVNKITIGEWQREDPRFQAYLSERAEKRARMDQIKEG